jgi:8-hydroxy-5-deazaflavin:NADPH oxidoreductase
MIKKIGIIGSGMVGQALANGFIHYGHEVMIGTNDQSKHKLLNDKTGGKAKIGNFLETAKFGDLLVLCTKGTGTESAIRQIGNAALSGKVVIDTTNPIADAPPVNGVLQYFTSANESLMEKLQQYAPEARFVKSFSCVGSACMVNPDFGETRPTMFICGNDTSAKNEVAKILEQFGWEYEDMGTAEAARAIEPLAILWCIPGFRNNRWTHALKMLKK